LEAFLRLGEGKTWQDYKASTTENLDAYESTEPAFLNPKSALKSGSFSVDKKASFGSKSDSSSSVVKKGSFGAKSESFSADKKSVSFGAKSASSSFDKKAPFGGAKRSTRKPEFVNKKPIEMPSSFGDDSHQNKKRRVDATGDGDSEYTHPAAKRIEHKAKKPVQKTPIVAATPHVKPSASNANALKKIQQSIADSRAQSKTLLTRLKKRN
jgi:hypothetical protein